jgi:hypothetical protein
MIVIILTMASSRGQGGLDAGFKFSPGVSQLVGSEHFRDAARRVQILHDRACRSDMKCAPQNRWRSQSAWRRERAHPPAKEEATMSPPTTFFFSKRASVSLSPRAK